MAKQATLIHIFGAGIIQLIGPVHGTIESNSIDNKTYEALIAACGISEKVITFHSITIFENLSALTVISPTLGLVDGTPTEKGWTNVRNIDEKILDTFTTEVIQAIQARKNG